jgi:dienelactone hydrolase
VFAVAPGTTALPTALRNGPGKFSRLTWDDKQTQLAFFHSPVADPKTSPVPPAIIHWKRGSLAVPVVPPTPAAKGPLLTALRAGTELKPNGKAVVKTGWQAHERGGLAFSLDGNRLFFGLVPPPPPKPAPGRPVVDLWHYKDDYIQPMQKARYGMTQAKTYRGFYDLKTGVCRQLADDAMPEVSIAPTGDLAVGADDRPYRRLIGGSEQRALADLSLINLKNGERKAILKKQAGVAWSPGGKYLMRWDGKAWHCLNVATGKSANLTEKLPKVPFANELFDQPSDRPSFGIAGWLPNDEAVLVYDRHDIWRFAPDGSSRKNITAGLGARLETSLRVVYLDPKQRTIDPKKPLLLRAENEKTRDTGFYRLEMGKDPQLLIMGARFYSNPIKAKSGDKYLLTISTFNDFPDLYIADLNFKEVRRITNLDAQKKPFIWGKAELVKYRSADGVPLQGVLLKPENFDPDKKYPMIVYIYERLSQNRHRFIEPRPGTSINPTYYVSNGYLVLMPDIAYNVGYPGQSAEKCVIPAIDKVIDQGCVNEKAIGLQGHSWGGYQTAYLVTRTTRFKAAAAGAPVTNMTSAYGGIRWGTGLPRQFQYERSQSRIGGTLWEYPTRFLENSPLFAADRVKTPLMMLHNDQDEAVPWQEGIQYYLALRRLEKEVYLFNYVGEGHGLRQRKNQADYTVRMQQFFDHHLKGAPMPTWMAKGEPYTPPPTTGTPMRTGRRGPRSRAE